MINAAENRFGLWRQFWSLLSAVLLVLGPSGGVHLWAGGPLIVTSPSFSVAEGQPVLFDISGGPIGYRVDGGPMAATTGGTVVIDQATGVARVGAMFQVWQDVPTSALAFQNLGGINPTGAFSDGDVSTVSEYNAVNGDCGNGNQNPVIFDADGSLFSALGFGSGTIGFAGPCRILTNGRITTGRAALNGAFQNGGGGDISSDEFDGAFIHEFGHLIGLDHSQINVNCLSGGCAAESDYAFGLPTMFPFLISGLTTGGVPTVKILAEDDIAWISRFYPETVSDAPNGKVPFSNVYGRIEGRVFFSDGTTHAQGVNVVARRVDNLGTVENESRRIAVSATSGYLFTEFLGQSLTGTSPPSDFGARTQASLIGFYSIPVQAGFDYTVEVESVNPTFVGGSGIGPLASEQVPIPGGTPEFYSGVDESDVDSPGLTTSVTVATPGVAVTGIDIILNGTGSRYDAWESARAYPAPEVVPPQLLWLREDRLEPVETGEGV